LKTFAVMPSNIALIKYMGKSEGNRPLNSSLSYTTPRFESYVELEESERDQWQELSPERIAELYRLKILNYEFSEKSYLKLNHSESEKFINFFTALKGLYKIKKNYTIRSYNAFPSSCGLASSASSFAALTVAAYKAFTGQEKIETEGLVKLSRLSQKGSGSSCRSFFSPWALWDEEGAHPAPLLIKLDHLVVIVEAEKKLVSSSEAHLRVLTSDNFVGRADRAKKRLSEVLSYIEKDWPRAFEVCWNEFWDMHSLFEASKPPFGYLKPASLTVLQILRKFWDEEGGGPLVTMDAGPNIHLLFREEDEELRDECLKRISNFKVL
jgi:diphosphomevalonate decarboxylase